ncbi:MAG: hypothetical protein KGL13_07855, partial [Gammaproteobacteria bacterium]|nr:hypothetical protein [Gammaproteobacteria bacterium]
AGAFEAVTTGGVTKYRYHLSADSREVAEVDLSNSGSTVNETVSYVLSDHLGSVDVVQTVNASTGAVIGTQYMSFSAWGGRREPNTWLPPVTQAEAQADHNANRYGFTHQEMLDNVGIIHMNGRIYDPNLGRFLSVDPVFEFPTNTQSLNPYSYVLNNPLSMTDPTGYMADSCGTGKTSCPDSSSQQGTTTVHVSYTPTGSHIAVSGTLTATPVGNGNFAVTASNAGLAAAFSAGAHAMFGNGAQSSQGAADAQRQPAQHTDIGSPAQTNVATGSQAQRFVNPTAGGVRDDRTGGGYFDSTRRDPDGTIRFHLATDFLATPSQDVEAPISGKVRELIVYGQKFTRKDPRLKQFRGVAIKGQDEYGFPTGYSAKLFYVAPATGIGGTIVHAGDIIGTAQNRAQFTPGMQNHVHMELYLLGQRVDPLNYIQPNY